MNPGSHSILLLTLVFVCLSSCFEEDKKVPEYPYTVYTIPDSVQLNRSYFDFESGSVVKTHKTNVWQFAFECGAAGSNILTNSEAWWFIYNTHQTSIEPSVQMPNINASMYDIQGLWPDSTAIGTWCFTNNSENTYTKNVYLLGRLVSGAYQEIKEVVFLELTDTTYSFSYHDRNTDTYDTVCIRKNNAYNFVYFSFDSKMPLNPEPPRTDYDIIFTSYYDTATLFNITQPYHVGGGLLNIYKTGAALDTLTDYAQMDLNTALNNDFIAKRDMPGYTWKNVTVDMNAVSATYKVKPNYIYLFKTQEGNYYKLRFLSYSIQGKSGFPRFEFSRLE